MKKTIAMLLALVMVFALCACGSKQDTAPAEGSAEAAAPADDFHIVLKLSHVFAPTEQLKAQPRVCSHRAAHRRDGAGRSAHQGPHQRRR